MYILHELLEHQQITVDIQATIHLLLLNGKRTVTLATAVSHITLCYFPDKNMVLVSCGDHVGFTFSLTSQFSIREKRNAFSLHEMKSQLGIIYILAHTWTIKVVGRILFSFPLINKGRNY